MVKVLAAVLTDRLASVDAACAEALGQGVHSADVIINILARRKDPGPPVTISIEMLIQHPVGRGG